MHPLYSHLSFSSCFHPNLSWGIHRDFDSFDLNSTDFVQQELIALKPRSSFSRLGHFLQIGSKTPSPQFSDQLKEKLWQKLNAAFPSYIYNGVPIPGLPAGKSFQDANLTFSDLQVRDFLPAIAVAYGYASDFSDKRATSFSINELFTPKFGPTLSSRLLNKLKNYIDDPEFASKFGRFDDIDSETKLPMDSSTKEIFDVTLYLPEIQVALELAPSVDLTSSSFSKKDIQDALFPNQAATVKSFSSFLKRKIIPPIRNALYDFNVGVSPVTTKGLTVDTPTLGAKGFDFGTFNEASTRLFPPTVDIRDVEVRFLQ